MSDLIGVIIGLAVIGFLLYILECDMKRQREEREKFKADFIHALNQIADALSNK